MRNQPAYPLAEAARYLRLAPATLRAWVLGRSYSTSEGVRPFHPLFELARRKPPTLSFWNLIEAHVLRSLRTEHGVLLKEVREAIRYAEKELKMDRLLLRKDLASHAGQVFLERYGELINLSASGQLALYRLLHEHLKRVEWDESRFPVRLYPFWSLEEVPSRRQIAIDPRIAYGRPIVFRRAITTRVIVDRLDAGETVADLAA
ncbi:MAG: hypothetical protein HY650_11680, partial [Acidobacteria bacterium]|nr:hypothetical protein [Acidobacteriota bacterium]